MYLSLGSISLPIIILSFPLDSDWPLIAFSNNFTVATSKRFVIEKRTTPFLLPLKFVLINLSVFLLIASSFSTSTSTPITPTLCEVVAIASVTATPTWVIATGKIKSTPLVINSRIIF